MGGMTLSNTNPWNWGTDREHSLEILKTYADAGGNFIDTSCNYTNGESEQVIGDFIKGDRDRYVIATKFTLYNFEDQKNQHKDDPHHGGNSRKNMYRSVDESLDRLGTDYLDILYLHMWDYTMDIKQMMRGLNDLISSGKVRHIGISDTPAWVVARANTMAQYHDWDPFVIYQFPYSMGYRDPEREVIPLANSMGMAMAPFQALFEGLFTGKYTRESQSGRLEPDKWQSPYGKSLLEMAREVDAIADELGTNSASVALRWVMDQKGAFSPIIGATKASQVEANLQAVDVSLKPEHFERLAKISNEKIGFQLGFPRGWLRGARPHIYASTFDKIDFPESAEM
jgi:aryl-alcohol dehydrogenase-like predicted oxidoreductase